MGELLTAPGLTSPGIPASGGRVPWHGPTHLSALNQIRIDISGGSDFDFYFRDGHERLPNMLWPHELGRRPKWQEVPFRMVPYKGSLRFRIGVLRRTDGPEN